MFISAFPGPSLSSLDILANATAPCAVVAPNVFILSELLETSSVNSPRGILALAAIFLILFSPSPNDAPTLLSSLKLLTFSSIKPTNELRYPPTNGMCFVKSPSWVPPAANSAARPNAPLPTAKNPDVTPDRTVLAASPIALPRAFVCAVATLTASACSSSSSVAPVLALASLSTSAPALLLPPAIFSIASRSLARVTSLATPLPPTLLISTSSTTI